MFNNDDGNGCIINTILTAGAFMLGWRIADHQQKARDREVSDLQKQIDNLKSYIS